MATKRSFEDLGPEGPGPGSPGPTSQDGAEPAFKRRKQQGKSKHKAKDGTARFAKNRARDIERLLKRNQELPADVKNDLQRELAAHNANVADHSFRKKRSAMISKYHMVRFFERKKATRLIKQLKRKIEKTENADDVEKLRQELHIAEVDEAYTMHYPHAEPYISLYGNAAGEEEVDEEHKHKPTLSTERPSMWTTIEKTMDEGPEALSRLRERRSPTDSPPSQGRPKKGPKKPSRAAEKPSAPVQPVTQEETAKPTPVPPTSMKGNQQPKNRRERRLLMHQAMQAGNDDNEEDEAGGGFFEGL